VFDPLHYLALIEQKINALDQAAPLAGWQLPEEFATLRRLLEARMGKAGKREFVQVLRCPVTHDALRWNGDGALTTPGGVKYPYHNGVACLLPEVGTQGTAQSTSIHEFYQDKGWEADDEGLFADTKAFVDTRPASLNYTRKCIARLARHFRKGGKYLLDAGSGPIPHDALLSYGDRFEKRVCLDLSAQALRRARDKLGDRGVYLQGDLTKLPLQDDSMDAITCNHVIYQLPEERQQIEAFRELWRVLKPGGVAVVVYWWWPYAPLAHRMERLAARLGWDAGPDALDGGEQGPKLVHEARERSWFEAQDWPFRYAYDSFRVVDNPFMRRYVPGNWRGSMFLQALFLMQVAAPKFCGRHGAIPAVLIRKNRR
jgi:SAM-dependent methyltransferase